MTFLNTAAQLVLLNLILWKSELNEKLWEDNGLANDLWFLMLLAVLDILGSLIKPEYLIKLIKRRLLEKGFKHPRFEPNQKQANEIYEAFDFNFEERLSKYCKVLLIAFSISSLFPLSPLIAIVYFIFFYWMDKVFLVRFCKVPNFCTSQIGHSMLHFFDFALIVYTVEPGNAGRLLVVPQHHRRPIRQNRDHSLRSLNLPLHGQYQVLDESDPWKTRGI